MVTRNRKHLIQITDVSVSGAHLSHKAIEPLTWCVLQGLGPEVDGQIVWIDGGEAGIRFAKALPDQVLLILREKFSAIDETRRLPAPDRRQRV